MDCMKKECVRKGPWLEEEDERLVKFVSLLGERRWDSLARVSGLKRSGKSCRLRWMNYLHPSLKHGPVSKDEEMIIFQLHALWGNKWAKIARRLPGRTDNEIKNYWKTHFRKKEQAKNYDKISDWRLDAGEITITRKTHEQVLKKNQTSLEDNQETFGGICEREGLCIVNSPYETRISDWISEISTDQSEVNLVEDRSRSNNEQNIDIGSWWFQETRDFEEFSCVLWS